MKAAQSVSSELSSQSFFSSQVNGICDVFLGRFWLACWVPAKAPRESKVDHCFFFNVSLDKLIRLG